MTTVTARPPLNLEKTKLLDILSECREASGVMRLWTMTKLRDYLRQQNQYTVIDEIGTIDDELDLNMIIGAGAPGQIYYAVMGRKARLAGIM